LAILLALALHYQTGTQFHIHNGRTLFESSSHVLIYTHPITPSSAQYSSINPLLDISQSQPHSQFSKSSISATPISATDHLLFGCVFVFAPRIEFGFSIFSRFSIRREQVKQYVVVGRKKPTAADAEPKIFKTKLFAPNTVVAKSRFFYFMSQLKRVKRANGEILSIQEVRQLFNLLSTFILFVLIQSICFVESLLIHF
jgi:hypothetical protein